MTAPRFTTLAAESLWGTTAIAHFLGVSPDFVLKLSKQEGTPIRRVAGRLFVTKTEISEWLVPSRRHIAASGGI